MNSIELKKEKVINIVAIDGRFCSLGISKGGKRFLNKSIKKLSFKLEFELKNLPLKISEKEKEIKNFSKDLSDPNFYLNDPEGFLLTSKNLADARSKLEKYELRWLELEELKSEV